MLYGDITVDISNMAALTSIQLPFHFPLIDKILIIITYHITFYYILTLLAGGMTTGMTAVYDIFPDYFILNYNKN